MPLGSPCTRGAQWSSFFTVHAGGVAAPLVAGATTSDVAPSAKLRTLAAAMRRVRLLFMISPPESARSVDRAGCAAGPSLHHFPMHTSWQTGHASAGGSSVARIGLRPGGIMTTRLIRKPIAIGGTALLAVTLAAGSSLASGTAGATANAPHATAKMPDAAVPGCDVLLPVPAGHHCLLPWPNDAFTVHAGPTTGRRLHISATVDPKNKKGKHVATAAQNRGDGFSPGSVIMTYVSGLNLAKSKVAPSTNIALSLAPTSPIVILDTATKTRVPYFAELDAQTTNKAKQLLLIHPARALTEGHRYAIVLRNLRRTNGTAIPPLASTKAAVAGRL